MVGITWIFAEKSIITDDLGQRRRASISTGFIIKSVLVRLTRENTEQEIILHKLRDHGRCTSRIAIEIRIEIISGDTRRAAVFCGIISCIVQRFWARIHAVFENSEIFFCWTRLAIVLCWSTTSFTGRVAWKTLTS